LKSLWGKICKIHRFLLYIADADIFECKVAKGQCKVDIYNIMLASRFI